MTITIEATYANGVLKPAAPLPLNENDRVILTLNRAAPSVAPRHSAVDWVQRTAGIVAAGSDEAVHHFAMDKNLEYDPGDEE